MIIYAKQRYQYYMLLASLMQLPFVKFLHLACLSWERSALGPGSEAYVSAPGPETLFLCLCLTQLREGEYVEFYRAGNVLDADMLIGRVRAAAVIGRVA
jgi:hypothetical protein